MHLLQFLSNAYSIILIENSFSLTKSFTVSSHFIKVTGLTNADLAVLRYY